MLRSARRRNLLFIAPSPTHPCERLQSPPKEDGLVSPFHCYASPTTNYQLPSGTSPAPRDTLKFPAMFPKVPSKMPKFFTLAVILLSAALAPAEGTRTWQQSSFDDFEKGTANGVAIASDGSLELAP